MSALYPSWIEIPAADLERALAFYRAVFGLTETPIYDDEPPGRIAVLLASDKSKRNPGVSLVQSPLHTPCHGGPQVNILMASIPEGLGYPFPAKLVVARNHKTQSLSPVD